MGKYSIKDLEQLSNIKAHTIRIWEQRYGILSPARTATNIRYYSDHDLRMILNISVLKNSGHKISKIAEMTSVDMGELVKEISTADQNYANQINALVLSMIDFDESRFDKIISTNTLQLGFESTMIKIVFPFLVRIGVLWQTGSINPAHEHFISNLVRQKLIVAIDGQLVRPSEDAKKFLLFLPEGEFHELSLLFANYLIRSRKYQSIYFGQSLPTQDLIKVKEHYVPDVFFTVITGFSSLAKVSKVFEGLHAHFPDSEFLASGAQILSMKDKLPPFIKVIDHFDTMLEFLES